MAWRASVEQGRVVMELDGTRLDGVRAAYVRQVPGAWPPLGRMEDGEPLVLRRWMTPFMLAREREAVGRGVLLELQRGGAGLLNGPVAGTLAQDKGYQLTCAAALGVPVPRTLTTNEPAAALAFITRLGRVVVKPSQGGALAEVVEAREARGPRFQRRLERIRAAPVTLQEKVDGDDVRLMLLGGRVVSCLAVRLPDGPFTDFRASPAYAAGLATYERVALPQGVREQARRWARACGLTLAGVDLKRAARGRHVFLECNSSPVYLDGERKSGDRVSAALAAWLVERAGRGGGSPGRRRPW
jgi:glutathione synthase/RimK-type ligase-like ATP-grasp enzyme